MRTVHSKAVELAQALREAGFVDPKTVYAHFYSRYQKGESIFKLQQDYLKERGGGRGIFHRYTDHRAEGRWRHKFEIRARNSKQLFAFLEGAGEIVPGAEVHMSNDDLTATITWTE